LFSAIHPQAFWRAKARSEAQHEDVPQSSSQKVNKDADHVEPKLAFSQPIRCHRSPFSRGHFRSIAFQPT
jgi:hypothetical protein